MSSIAINQVKKAIESQYIEDGRNLVRTYSLAFRNMITQANHSLDMYAVNSIFQDGTTEEISEWLTQHISMRPQSFMNVFYCDKDGNAFSDGGKKINIQDRDYFTAIFSGKFIYHLGSAVYSKTTGKRIIHVSRAIYDRSGNIKGMIGASIELTQIQKLLSSAQISNAMQPFILDNDGICISHPEEQALMQPYTPSRKEFEKFSTKNISKKDIPLFMTVNEKGEKVHVFTEKIKDINWTVGVSIPDSKIYDTYNQLTQAKIKVFLIVIFAGIIFYIFSLAVLTYLRKKYESAQTTDPLTELATRQNLEQKASSLIDQNPDGKFILITSDFTGFKFINRNYGERTGNETLITYANAIKEFRSVYGGIAARGYADHFYYFNQVESISRFLYELRTVQTKIEQISAKGKYPFTPKYGISVIMPEKDGSINSGRKSISQLMGEASIAKNTIKNNTENCYAIFNSQMAKRVLLEQRIERTMEKSLSRGEFFVVYQPKINLHNDKVIGAEALVRWNSPELGFLTPDKFIPIFETNGFIKKLDFAVYEMVFKFIRRQLDEKQPVVPISINMSRIHVNTNSFMKEFMKRFEKYNIPTNLVEIEILERSITNEKPILQEITNELHRNGFSVAMDDFGSGESSLNMLNSVPIDVLKFDKNFLKNNPESEKTKLFITSLIRMAQQLQKKTIFEGVETEEQRDFLKSIQCDSVQGFFYSKPLLEEDFIKFIRSHS